MRRHGPLGHQAFSLSFHLFCSFLNVRFVACVSSSRAVLAFKLLRTVTMTQSFKLTTERCLDATFKSHLWSIACCLSLLFFLHIFVILPVSSADTRKNTTNHHNVKHGEKAIFYYQGLWLEQSAHFALCYSGRLQLSCCWRCFLNSPSFCLCVVFVGVCWALLITAARSWLVKLTVLQLVRNHTWEMMGGSIKSVELNLLTCLSVCTVKGFEIWSHKDTGQTVYRQPGTGALLSFENWSSRIRSLSDNGFVSKLDMKQC